ncbi:sensor histidine kinase [Pontibacter sp. E15-1]|uniref:sensor histidine kinase n=1 Tax=Pontibacter sp. E15-1 TaxID=2919918 RepID=UPI001F4F964C|nr:sensor histidine kinase [Pontibacter sp. E15-1]MCJ8164527.1 sensor histidine kinase [Pontibacter sp. E15-1]
MSSILQPLLIITPIILLLVLGVILFVVQYQKRLLQHQEQVQKLQTTRQYQLLETTMQAQEKERRRVARDLHDEVGSMLSLVKLNLHQLMANLGEPGDDVRRSEQTIKQLLDEVIGSIRRISHDLMPVVLDKLGLVQGLESLRKSVPGTSGLTVTLACNDKGKRLNSRLELILYRVVQELLNNTLKHAQASRAEIGLHFTEHEVLLSFSDNGIGFDYEAQLQKADYQAGVGLVSLQSRINLLNGKMITQSSAGGGTRFDISVPTTQETNTLSL